MTDSNETVAVVTPAQNEVLSPEQLNDLAASINKAADNPTVQGVEAYVVPKIPKKVRGALYEVGKWVGVAGAIAATIAANLEGQPALYAAAAAGVLLAASNFLAKAHLA